jgi:hypothetical protein
VPAGEIGKLLLQVLLRTESGVDVLQRQLPKASTGQGRTVVVLPLRLLHLHTTARHNVALRLPGVEIWAAALPPALLPSHSSVVHCICPA